jgi:hypothetical protein
MKQLIKYYLSLVCFGRVQAKCNSNTQKVISLGVELFFIYQNLPLILMKVKVEFFDINNFIKRQNDVVIKKYKSKDFHFVQ